MSKTRKKIFLISIYIDDFLFISNSFKVLAQLKDFIIKKYNVKNLEKVKIITKQQVTRDFDTKMLKVN